MKKGDQQHGRSREIREEEPHFTVDFFLPLHGSAEDYKRLPKLLSGYDVYASEHPGWTKVDEHVFNLISDAEVDPPSSEPPVTARDLQRKAIYGSHKVIIFVDVPKANSLASDLERIFEDFQIPMRYFIKGMYELAVGEMRLVFQLFSQFNK